MSLIHLMGSPVAAIELNNWTKSRLQIINMDSQIHTASVASSETRVVK